MLSKKKNQFPRQSANRNELEGHVVESGILHLQKKRKSVEDGILVVVHEGKEAFLELFKSQETSKN